VNSVDHVLDEFFLGFSKSSSVGNVEDTVIGLGMLSVDTSDLNLVLISDLVELFLLLHELWQVDVNGSSHSSSKVGWARGDVSKMLIMGKFDVSGLKMSNCSAESVEDFDNAGILLHGDDSELILLVDPDQESLGVVVEDTSARWPVSVEVASLKESVTLLEEEMVLNKLLRIFSTHSFKWVEFALEITLEGVAGSDNLLHDLESLLFGDSWAEWIISQVSSDSDSSGLDHGTILLGELSVLDAVRSHVRGVFGPRFVLVVVGDALVEEFAEGRVSVVGSSIDTNTRVLVLDSGEDASLESNALGARLVLVLLPDLLGQALFELRFAFWGEESVEVDKLIRCLECKLFLGGLGDSVF